MLKADQVSIAILKLVRGAIDEGEDNPDVIIAGLQVAIDVLKAGPHKAGSIDALQRVVDALESGGDFNAAMRNN